MTVTENIFSPKGRAVKEYRLVDDRQPWLEGSAEEYCWCDGCIRERNEEMNNA
jgi:hypothetical protein